MKSLKHLKAGDKVVRTNYKGKQEVRTVEKITPSGLIKVDDNFYYLNGNCRGGWNGYNIQEATPEIMQEVADNDLVFKTLGYMRNVETITADQARRIAAILLEGTPLPAYLESIL